MTTFKTFTPRLECYRLTRVFQTLFCVMGLSDGLRTDAIREHPRIPPEVIRAAQKASQNAALTRPG